jgi:membrane-bound lytic murein transglycosylase B
VSIRTNGLEGPGLTRRSLCTAALLAPCAVRAQSSDPKFVAWLAGVRTEALRAGVDHGHARQRADERRADPEVMELARNQPEFKMSFDGTSQIVVSPERVTRGRRC